MAIESTRQLGPLTRRVRICECGKKWVTFEEVAREASRRDMDSVDDADRDGLVAHGR